MTSVTGEKIVLDGVALHGWRGTNQAAPTTAELASYSAASADHRADRLAGAVASPVWTCVPFGAVARDFFARFLGDRVTGRLVHLSHTVGLDAPVRAGAVIAVDAGVAGLRQTAQGAVVDLRGTAVDADGQRLGWQAGTFLVAGAVAVGPFAVPEVRSAAAASVGADAEGTIGLTVASDQSVRYAAASADHNPIHLDPAAARQIGFPGVILHGLCTLAMTCHALERVLGGGEVRVLSTEFTRPVGNGDPLTVRWRRTHAGAAFEVVNRRRRPVLRGGRLEF